MEKVYCVFNPKLGMSEEHNDFSTLSQKIAEIALEFYLDHCYRTPFNTVIKNDDGSQTWVFPNGETNQVTAEALIEIKKLIEERLTKTLTQDITN